VSGLLVAGHVTTGRFFFLGGQMPNVVGNRLALRPMLAAAVLHGYLWEYEIGSLSIDVAV